MPHPKKHMKLTGDTHPPEVESDLAPFSDDAQPLASEAEAQPRVYADGWVPPEAAAALEPQPAKPRWMMLGAALAVGFVLARMLKR